ncbi:cyclic nucleotide-binding domain protein, putative (macronuclear) [Tetrahymena thermophila SB210]|uniref:Cyclic nucleotide-binding domain protein, putative n=1 Tax=Tetrahymena thermophila (strain SB210) TaxID=312017 RepID=I7MI59_TETTS|nr:cyclic nucleotide-binding domain protein, putative [Tetrahymena thermophila SB210]EAR90911.2 cyclic nucleotide-binding domain protein, putative [Tetrahymena thermophila SB210]|eukprot:XP_001011156.2 cyclic nucleotide-binding domain protein, putative [Tetrahymena thermophila SB210]
MLNRRKKSINLSCNNSEIKIRKGSLKIQEIPKNHKSFLIQQNNSIFQNMNSFQSSMHTNLVLNKQLIQSQQQSKIDYQSYDNFDDDNNTSKSNMQNQKINKEYLNFLANSFENRQELSQQFKLLHNKQSNLSKIDNSNIELSKLNDADSQEIYNETLFLNIQSNKNSQSQRREEEYISSSPMIENKIMKFNFSYTPSIDVFKYNNQQENYQN